MYFEVLNYRVDLKADDIISKHFSWHSARVIFATPKSTIRYLWNCCYLDTSDFVSSLNCIGLSVTFNLSYGPAVECFSYLLKLSQQFLHNAVIWISLRLFFQIAGICWPQCFRPRVPGRPSHAWMSHNTRQHSVSAYNTRIMLKPWTICLSWMRYPCKLSCSSILNRCCFDWEKNVSLCAVAFWIENV